MAFFCLRILAFMLHLIKVYFRRLIILEFSLTWVATHKEESQKYNNLHKICSCHIVKRLYGYKLRIPIKNCWWYKHLTVDEMPARVHDEARTVSYLELELLTAFLEGMLALNIKRLTIGSYLSGNLPGEIFRDMHKNVYNLAFQNVIYNN